MRRLYAPVLLVGILLELLAPITPGHAASQLQVEATLSPQTIGIDETAQLTIRASGSGLGGLDIRPSFHLDNLEIAAGPFESTQFQFVNGHTSRSRSLTWQLKPHRIGDAFVRSIRVEVGGETMELPDQRLTVQEAPTGAPSPAPGPGTGLPDPFAQLFGRAPHVAPPPQSSTSPRVFLRADIDPVNPYVGEQATYTLYLFTQTSVGGVNPESLPDFHGFWVKEIAQPDQPNGANVELEGQRFRRVVLLQRALFPLRAGRQPLEAAKVELQVEVADGSPFGNLFPQVRRVERTSNQLALQVRPLPPPPANYSGAVGQLQADANLSPPTVHVGDAATLRIRLYGSGHLQGLATPSLQAPDGVQIYSPQGDTAEKLRGVRVEAERVWNYPVIPKRSGHWDIVVPAFTYFDPEEQAYRTIPSSHLSLTALEVARQAAPPATSGQGGKPRNAPPSRKASSRLRRLVASWWPAAAMVLVLLGAPSLFYLRKMSRGPQAGVDARFLSELESIHTLRKPRQVARRLEQAWQRLLSEDFHLAAGIDPARWADQLRQRSIDRALCDRMDRIAADLHYLRYAPELAAVDTLRDDVLERSRALARDLAH